jgi:hypothetical protein
MLAFTGTRFAHDEILAIMRAHAAADELVKGQYWQGGKGCAVGCMVKSWNHSLYEPMFGIPAIIAGLEDAIFEGLPNDEAKSWPIQFLEAIKPGSDLSKVAPKFFVWLLTDPEHEVALFNKDPLVAAVAALWQRVLDSDAASIKNWEPAALNAAARSGWRAALFAAQSVKCAANGRAWYAASFAALSARHAVDSVKFADDEIPWYVPASFRFAAWTGSSSFAEHAAYRTMRDKLLGLLRGAA